MFKSMFLLAVSILLSSVPSFAANEANSYKDSYVLPESIKFDILEKPKGVTKSIRLAISAQSCVGDLKNLRIFFSSSKDIKVNSEKYTIKEIKQGEKHIVNILAVRLTRSKGDLGSWLRMGVSYTPDYDALIKAVSDEQKYPNPRLRQKMIDDLITAKETQEPYIDAVRHFLPNTKARKKSSQNQSNSSAQSSGRRTHPKK